MKYVPDREEYAARLPPMQTARNYCSIDADDVAKDTLTALTVREQLKYDVLSVRDYSSD